MKRIKAMRWEVYADGEYVYTFNTEHEAYEEKRMLRQYGYKVTVKVIYK